ncbi:uncharacterized protein CMU_010780 [Cryptosporidium muris RN66]|uniref:Uncharacterized protein n=1 Tax=Cryptosporidium muris (strain RN66) TaxID=441375 RepID=B6AIT9_CRYMR|nr:uncharacterized protein CMU_010780 [Cryptosporidium muris RN66]EEA08130.1 hypothetical protein, conserved [Cryptosporidium muris RN66]|eukprot:XP_002142479.1 hypothetical protein [Cryptosporidium muris RN66]
MNKIENKILSVPVIFNKDESLSNDGQYELFLLEFQGSLSVSRLNEDGTLESSIYTQKLDGNIMGKVVDYFNIKKMATKSHSSWLEYTFTNNNCFEIHIGFHKLQGKVEKLKKPLALLGNCTDSKLIQDLLPLRIYGTIHYKIIFDKRPHINI